MGNVDKRTADGTVRYFLSDRPLSNGDEVELLLRGNKGWTAVAVDGLPGGLKVRWTNDEGASLHTSLPDDAELRWP
jgi:hypothetical protein